MQPYPEWFEVLSRGYLAFSFLCGLLLVREDGMSQVEVAELLGRHKSWVCRRLALIERLGSKARDDLRVGLTQATEACEPQPSVAGSAIAHALVGEALAAPIGPRPQSVNTASTQTHRAGLLGYATERTLSQARPKLPTTSRWYVQTIKRGRPFCCLCVLDWRERILPMKTSESAEIAVG